MAYTVADNTIAFESFKKKGVVVLPLKVYEEMKAKLARLVAETKVLQIVAEGEREYKEGKLQPVNSLRELA